MVSKTNVDDYYSSVDPDDSSNNKKIVKKVVVRKKVVLKKVEPKKEELKKDENKTSDKKEDISLNEKIDLRKKSTMKVVKKFEPNA